MIYTLPYESESLLVCIELNIEHGQSLRQESELLISCSSYKPIKY